MTGYRVQTRCITGRHSPPDFGWDRLLVHGLEGIPVTGKDCVAIVQEDGSLYLDFHSAVREVIIDKLGSKTPPKRPVSGHH